MCWFGFHAAQLWRKGFQFYCNLISVLTLINPISLLLINPISLLLIVLVSAGVDGVWSETARRSGGCCWSHTLCGVRLFHWCDWSTHVTQNMIKHLTQVFTVTVTMTVTWHQHPGRKLLQHVKAHHVILTWRSYLLYNKRCENTTLVHTWPDHRSRCQSGRHQSPLHVFKND